jgi:hypothetical protein
MNDKKISPLEILVAAHNDVPPVKVIPRNRLQEETSVIPIIEDTVGEEPPLVISNSSLTFNFNMNIDSDVVEKAMRKSAEVAKNIAAVGAAFLGTAMFLGGRSKRLGKIKIPISPKTKLPRL